MNKTMDNTYNVTPKQTKLNSENNPRKIFA